MFAPRGEPRRPTRSDVTVHVAERLRTAGVEVTHHVHEGVTHEFFGMGAVVSDARSAENYAGDRLKDAFKR
jgi:acetyl esterase